MEKKILTINSLETEIPLESKNHFNENNELISAISIDNCLDSLNRKSYHIIAQRESIYFSTPRLTSKQYNFLTIDGDIYDSSMNAVQKSRKTDSTNSLESLFEQYNILCCDDVSLIRRMIERTLKKVIKTFDCAENGLEAIKLVESHNNLSHYDLILMDAYMPKVNESN